MSEEVTALFVAKLPSPAILLFAMAAVAAISASMISPSTISLESIEVPRDPAGKLVSPDPSPVIVPVVVILFEPKSGLIFDPAIAAVAAISASRMPPSAISEEVTELLVAKFPRPAILLLAIAAVAAMSASIISPSVISADSMELPRGPAGKLVNPDPSPVMVPVVTIF